MVGFDVESTAPDPFVARIVQAAVAAVGGGEPTDARSWIVNPGVEIPEEATAVHGITTERAQAEGLDAREGLEQILAELVRHLAPGGIPLVIFNARYDMTVLAAECRRHGIELPEAIRLARVVDPMVADKQLDRYRKSYPGKMTPEEAAAAGVASSRTLGGMCEVYADRFHRRSGKPKPTLLVDAHDAVADTIAVCRLAFMVGGSGEVIRRVRNRQEAIERAQLVREWERVRRDLDLLHEAQTRWTLVERDRFAAYKREQGEIEVAERIASERGWPILELPPLCEVCGGTEEWEDPLALEEWERAGGALEDRPGPEPCPECSAA